MQLQFKINSETITFSMFLPRLAYPVQSCCSWSTAPTSAFVKQPTFNIIKIRQSLLQIQCKINSKMIAFSMCLHRFADAVPSCCSLSTAPASAFLKQPTFRIIKNLKLLLQNQIKFNSEMITFPMFLPRLSDPVSSCCSMSTGWLILFQASAPCLWVANGD